MKEIDYIEILETGVPKYQQLINCILEAITNERLKINDKLPSLNALMKKFNLSQDTVLNAYNHLKSKGIISSAVGKGYFITSNNTIDKHKIFILFDNFTFYKENIYKAINNTIKDHGIIDIFFHHNNASQYKRLITDAVGNYTSYIIMSIEDIELDNFFINTLPPKNVYLLDIASERLKKKFPFVAQNFERDIIKCLSNDFNVLQKYSRIKFLIS